MPELTTLALPLVISELFSMLMVFLQGLSASSGCLDRFASTLNASPITDFPFTLIVVEFQHVVLMQQLQIGSVCFFFIRTAGSFI